MPLATFEALSLGERLGTESYSSYTYGNVTLFACAIGTVSVMQPLSELMKMHFHDGH
jgi:hypothetical protein